MKRFGVLLCCAFFIASQTGCAPGLGESLRVESVADYHAPEKSGAGFEGLEVLVQSFVDSRANQAIGEIEGRPLKPAGNVAMNVQRAFERGLRDAGVDLKLFGV